jgi:hypothetical protein
LENRVLKNTRLILCAVGLVSLCLAPFASPTYATTFQAQGVFADGATLDGVLTIDTNSGSVVSSGLTISGVGTFSTLISQANFGAPLFYSVVVDNTVSSEEFSFGLLANTLVGYSGGNLCSNTTGNCFASVYYPIPDRLRQVSLLSGSLLEPSGLAPEPAGLSFCATGFVIGALIFNRRKRFASVR